VKDNIKNNSSVYQQPVKDRHTNHIEKEGCQHKETSKAKQEGIEVNKVRRERGRRTSSEKKRRMSVLDARNQALTAAIQT